MNNADRSYYSCTTLQETQFSFWRGAKIKKKKKVTTTVEKLFDKSWPFFILKAWNSLKSWWCISVCESFKLLFCFFFILLHKRKKCICDDIISRGKNIQSWIHLGGKKNPFPDFSGSKNHICGKYMYSLGWIIVFNKQKIQALLAATPHDCQFGAFPSTHGSF